MMLILLVLLDIIVLTNGHSVEGKVKKITDDEVIVEVRGGEVIFDRPLVERIIKKPYKMEVEEPPKQQKPKTTSAKKTPQKKKKPQKEASKKRPEKEEQLKPLTPEEMEYLQRLVGLLGSRKPAQRRFARGQLSRFGPRATPVLIGVLRDANFWRRMNAASLLGEFSRPEAAKHLIPLLVDPVLAVRAAAHHALTRITKSYVPYNPNNPSLSTINLWRKTVDNFLKKIEGKQKDKERIRGWRRRSSDEELPPWEMRPPPRREEKRQEPEDAVIEP